MKADQPISDGQTDAYRVRSVIQQRPVRPMNLRDEMNERVQCIRPSYLLDGGPEPEK